MIAFLPRCVEWKIAEDGTDCSFYKTEKFEEYSNILWKRGKFRSDPERNAKSRPLSRYGGYASVSFLKKTWLNSFLLQDGEDWKYDLK